jgi:hypothetical protein
MFLFLTWDKFSLTFLLGIVISLYIYDTLFKVSILAFLIILN